MNWQSFIEWRDDYERRIQKDVERGILRKRVVKKVWDFTLVAIEKVPWLPLGEPVPGGELNREEIDD